MSSNLRTTSVPVGYFVMSAATFDSDASGDEIFSISGLSGTEDFYMYDEDFYEDLSNGGILTFQDYGVTDHSALSLRGGATATETRVDLRKVALVSAANSPNITVANYATEAGVRYVPLGTLRNTSTPFTNSDIPSSVQLIGKYF